MVLATDFFRQRKTVATAGRSYGGPSEKFVGGFGGIFRSCPLTSQKLPLSGNQQAGRISGQLLRRLLQNPRNFPEVAPEVRPAVHTALLCLSSVERNVMSSLHVVGADLAAGTLEVFFS